MSVSECRVALARACAVSSSSQAAAVERDGRPAQSPDWIALSCHSLELAAELAASAAELSLPCWRPLVCSMCVCGC